MPFAATWTDPEIVILSEVSQIEKEKYHVTYLCIYSSYVCTYVHILMYILMYVYSTYMWNLERNDTNELTYKTETDSQTSRTSLWLPGEG